MSDLSNGAAVTVHPPDDEKPSVPGNLTAAAGGPTSIDLSWEASSDNVAVTGYCVYRDGSLIATIGPATSYSDSSVVPGITYRYELRAFDAAGNVSDPSNPAMAMVNPLDTEKPTAPGNLNRGAQRRQPRRSRPGRPRATTWASPATRSTATGS